MVPRDDLHGPNIAPKVFADFILRIGGKNPFGEPIYRLVWAPTRFTVQAGMWTEWDKNLSVQERGGIITCDDGVMRRSTTMPLRIACCLKPVPKYPSLKGWILERWMPAWLYGAKGDWYARKVPGTTFPMLGPFPEFGDYEQVTMPSVRLPNFSAIKQSIEECEFHREAHGKTLDAVVRERVNDAEHEYEAKMEKSRLEAEAFVRDQLSPWSRISLGAGRWRNELAKRAGITEHAGN